MDDIFDMTINLNDSEDYYRKLLLLDKMKPSLNFIEKAYIFKKEYCWDILKHDKDYPYFLYSYTKKPTHNREHLDVLMNSEYAKLYREGTAAYYHSLTKKIFFIPLMIILALNVILAMVFPTIHIFLITYVVLSILLIAAEFITNYVADKIHKKHFGEWYERT